jgi:hypothetical protein
MMTKFKSVRATAPNLFSKTLLILFLLFFTACKKSKPAQVAPPNAVQTPPIDSSLMMKLGKKKENPYALNMMRRAAARVAPQKRNAIETNKVYYKFKPENDAHLQMLVDFANEHGENVVLTTYPWDYEIAEEGQIYIDPAVSDPAFTYQYTALSVGHALPDVPYEVVEELYIPNREDEAEDDMESYALIVTGNAEMPKDTVRNARWWWLPKYWPDGRIYLHDYQDANYEREKGNSLKQMRVRVHSWFDWTHVNTDDNGYFRSPNWYKMGVDITALFSGSVAEIRYGFWENFLHGVFYNFNHNKLGSISGKSANGKHFGIAKGADHWKKAVVHNAVLHFNEFARNNGMAQIPSHTCIWISKGKDTKGSAPMLKTFGVYITVHDVLKWFIAISGIDFVARLLVSMPDVTLTFNEGDASQGGVRFEEMLSTLTFHELAHVSHAYFAGFRFWERVVRAETANILATSDSDPYRDGTKPNWTEGEVVGLAEGWASFTAYKIAKSKGIKVAKFYDVLDYIISTRPRKDENPSIKYGRGRSWIPRGMFWDLSYNDTRYLVLNTPNALGVDVMQYSLQNKVKNIPVRSLYEHLRYVSTITEYKNMLSNQQFWYLENGQWKLNQRQDILDLFKVYGY